ncbi:disease susceptibility protein LOV1-like [Salvia divinorum]|uniref:Disease susceptibility protein LOV1-like n=1 Tax=Salvia divinorum TaxID=28513 RepID=A0ABD1H6S0_SALDI
MEQVLIEVGSREVAKLLQGTDTGRAFNSLRCSTLMALGFGNCPSLFEFSGVALKMESLREFGTRSVYGRAMKVEKWKSIESLKGIRLEDWVEMSSGLIMPNSHLRELSIHVQNDMDDEMVSKGRASLQKMTNLVKLHLKLYYRPETMLKLIPNLESLTSLKMDGHGFSLECSAAVAFPPNLSHLTLTGMKDLSMEELGKLPKLQYLTLRHLYVSEDVGRMKILHDGFPCLKALSLKDIFELRESAQTRHHIICITCRL